MRSQCHSRLKELSESQSLFAGLVGIFGGGFLFPKVFGASGCICICLRPFEVPLKIWRNEMEQRKPTLREDPFSLTRVARAYE